MKYIQMTPHRLPAPYILTLRHFKGQGTALVKDALDHHPNREFGLELARQKELYERSEQDDIEKAKRHQERHEAIGREAIKLAGKFAAADTNYKARPRT